jgi:hypothetical protein
MEDCPASRSSNSDTTGEGRQRTLPSSVEEAFRKQARFELFEGELQRPGTAWLHGLGDKLELTARLIDGDSAPHQHGETILGTEPKELGLATEEHDWKLGVTVLEGEVDVAGGSGAAVGYLALDPDVLVFLLDLLTNAGNEVADAPNATLGGAYGHPIIHRDFGSRL